METQLDKIQIFKENFSTLKRTSLDDNGEDKQYMTMSEKEAVDFDKVKNAYVRGMELSDLPCSSDALYQREPGKFYFVEFKNGRLNKNNIYSIQKKIYDSLLIFNDIMDTNISFCRENVGFILVYNEAKNPEGDSSNISDTDAPTPSRVSIGQYFSNKARKSFIRFDLGRFERLYFHEVFTYTAMEFEEFINI